jgi:hypothetical protein
MNSPWQTVLDPGGPASQDAATITNPTTQVVKASTHLFRCKANGTLVIARLGYDAGLTGVTSPIVKLFGRYNSSDDWQILQTKAGLITATLTVATSTDVTNGTLKYTTPDQALHTWDRLGCEELLLGIQTALAGGGSGVTSNSIIQLKLI